jgi:polyhydroxyalkanoate synthesis regulator phasin
VSSDTPTRPDGTNILRELDVLEQRIRKLFEDVRLELAPMHELKSDVERLKAEVADLTRRMDLVI